MRRVITTRLQDVEAFLGYFPVQVTSGILDRIKTLEMGILVVTLIFNLIKALLIVISILIIYSLLMVSIEAKNFEMAVTRMVGMSKNGVICLIVCQSFMYVIPALMASFGICVLVLK